MSSTFRIDYVEAALLALIRAKLPIAYGAPVSTESLGDDDFDENGNLILRPPATRVRFRGARYQSLRDNQALTYEPVMPFEILCFEQNLRGPEEERQQTLVLVATVLDVVAGARLTLADEESTRTMPIRIVAVDPVDMEQGPVDQHFAIHIDVEGIAQFGGANAAG